MSRRSGRGADRLDFDRKAKSHLAFLPAPDARPGLFAEKFNDIELLCMRKRENGPDWDRLFEIAAAQDGYFSVDQAQSVGISRPNLQAHLHRGHVLRPRRGVYRLVRYPVSDHEELAEIWLQSDQEGVFSHETALSLYDLSDVLPARIHITLPTSWRRRRQPDGAVVHYAEVPPEDRDWFGAVPVTSVRRTLRACATGGL